MAEDASSGADFPGVAADDSKWLTPDGRWNGMTFAEYRAKGREVLATDRRIEAALRDQVMRLEGQAQRYYEDVQSFVRAVASVRARYPEDIFPSDGTSPDAAGARFARSICDEIMRLANEDEL